MIKCLNRIFFFFLVSALVVLTGNAATKVPDSFSARIPLYASSSKLASGHWVKLRVSKNGIYKITFDQLKSLGFSNPSKVRVFGFGGNLLSEKLNSDYNDDLPEVNTYLGDSYILFYGVGNLSWSYATLSKSFSYVRNSYSDYGYYFLSEVDGSRRTVPQSDKVTDSAIVVHRTHYENDVYISEKANPYNGGTVWFDSPIAKSGSKSITFPFANLVGGNYCKVSLKSYIGGAGTNDSNQTTLSSDSSSISTYSTSLSSTAFSQTASESDGMKLTVNFKSSNSSAYFYLQNLTASALCYNRLHNGYLSFNNADGSDISAVGEYVVSNASASTVLWNVSDPQNIVSVPYTIQGDSLRFRGLGGAYQSFVAFNPGSTAFLSVDSFYTVANQNLHALSGADLIILTPSAYISQAKQLANLHAENDGISSYVITPGEIYNEFSSGTTDPTAIRAFMKMLYDRAQDDDERVAPRYLLLFGSGCYDNKGILASSSAVRRNLMITYQTGSGSLNYPADGYFGMLADNPSSFNIVNESCQVGVGRLPFTNASEANNVINKISTYMQNKLYGKWKSKALILADDNEGNLSSFNEFLTNAERLCDTISNANADVVAKKVYYDAYTRSSETSGYRFLDVENAITDAIADGTMYINYIGHSNAVNWSAEKTFTQNQVASLSNKKLGVWFSASCEFSEYDNYSTSCGESLILAPNGGAIAVVATPRMVYASSNQLFDCQFSKYFFSQSEGEAIGDVLRKAINSVTNNDIRVKFPLLGDPALRIVSPNSEYKVITDSISVDTLKALSHVTISGHVGSDSNVLSTFNGKVDVTVYDKAQMRYTKGNYGSQYITSYKDYPTVIYSSEADVVDGEFNFSFIVPSDIAYNYGNGRIVYYAYDAVDSIDVTGSTTQFIIGGMVDSVPSDSVGPEINLYVNSTAFRSGDVVGSNPVIFAEVSDANGINSSGVGIGHDITLQLNGGDKVILNDYFSYVSGSGSDGKVVYQLSDLENGVYTLSFKVWDLLGNSSTKSVTFKVENGLSPHIDNVVAVSNPATDAAQILVNYDRPLTMVSYRVSIFDLQGRRINKLSGTDNTTDGQLSLSWNLKDEAGRRVEPGVYVYRVEIKTNNSDFVGNSEKIVVLPQ